MTQQAWSYSSLDAFETCPRRYYEVRLRKNFKEPEGEALTWGKFVHENAERALKGNGKMPDTLQHMQPLITSLRNRPGNLMVETELAFTQHMKPTLWFAKDVWLRVKVDASILSPDRTAIATVDWKTNNKIPTDDKGQLKLTAIGWFHQYPEVRKVVTTFAYVKHNHLTPPQTYTRDQLPQLWNDFFPRVQRYQLAHQQEEFPPRPSGLCKKHCIVKTCQHWGT